MPPLIVLIPLFSHSSALICSIQNRISFPFIRFRTLSPKHPGVGYRKPTYRPRYCSVSLCAASNTSFSLPQHAPRAGRRYDQFGLPAPYWLNHLRGQFAGTPSQEQRRSNCSLCRCCFSCGNVSGCVPIHAREYRRINAFQGYHAR
jgi:hypothetical protein